MTFQTVNSLPLPLSALLDRSGAGDKLIAAGMSPTEAAAKAELFDKAATQLIATGSSPTDLAVAIFVPGRIEVLGKHTDYCGGRSLLCTVEKGLCFVAVPRRGPVIDFHALDLGESVMMSLDPELHPSTGHWSNYPMTIARRIARNFPGVSNGAHIAMAGDLPPASGLSSSSAMMIGTFLALSALNHLSERPEYSKNIRSTEDLAGYMGCCENGQDFKKLRGDKGVGTFGGSQDHTAILCCKPARLSTYSFCPVVHERDVALPAQWQFVVASSGIVAEKTGGALERYNRVSVRAATILGLWNRERHMQATCLREAVESSPTAATELRELLQHCTELDNELRLTERLDQFLLEWGQLIPKAVDAIESADKVFLRTVVNASQMNAERFLQNQIPQTITLQQTLQSLGAFASSAFGAGFGGSVWGLVEEKSLDQLTTNLSAAHIRWFVTRPSCPVTWIS